MPQQNVSICLAFQLQMKINLSDLIKVTSFTRLLPLHVALIVLLCQADIAGNFYLFLFAQVVQNTDFCLTI